ncbi:MAG TPA: hypothetical protein VK964_20470 [Nocardioidaceae bacterium]|nr:hypothetical protein [Nocardioidaceae bacterium]
MSGLMNMVSRFARGTRTNGRRPGAARRPAGSRGMGGGARGRGGATGLEGTARRLLRRAR